MLSLSREPCPRCGRTADQLIPLVVRTKDLIKVKDMLANPAIHVDTLESITGVDELQVVVGKENQADPFPMDAMRVRVAATREDRQALVDIVKAQTVRVVSIRPIVEFASARELSDADMEAKAVRSVDRRRGPGRVPDVPVISQ